MHLKGLTLKSTVQSGCLWVHQEQETDHDYCKKRIQVRHTVNRRIPVVNLVLTSVKTNFLLRATVFNSVYNNQIKKGETNIQRENISIRIDMTWPSAAFGLRVILFHNCFYPYTFSLVVISSAYSAARAALNVYLAHEPFVYWLICPEKRNT